MLSWDRKKDTKKRHISALNIHDSLTVDSCALKKGLLFKKSVKLSQINVFVFSEVQCEQNRCGCPSKQRFGEVNTCKHKHKHSHTPTCAI